MFVKERAPFASNNKKVTKQDPHPNSSSSVGGGRSRGKVTSIVREPLKGGRERAIVVPSERDGNRAPPPSRFDPRIRIRSGTRKSSRRKKPLPVKRANVAAL